MEKLKELVELAKKATPGEWTADWYDDDRGYVTWYIDLERQRAAFFLADGGPELNGTGNPSDFDKADCNFIAAANPESILAIADAFRALEKRAEAAEEKLVELENQEPLHLKKTGCGYDGADSYAIYQTIDEPTFNSLPWQKRLKVFSEAAPAVNLAELVPDVVGIHDMDPDSKDIEVVTAIAQCEGWNACRAAILRNIEESK